MVAMYDGWCRSRKPRVNSLVDDGICGSNSHEMVNQEKIEKKKKKRTRRIATYKRQVIACIVSGDVKPVPGLSVVVATVPVFISDSLARCMGGLAHSL